MSVENLLLSIDVQIRYSTYIPPTVDQMRDILQYIKDLKEEAKAADEEKAAMARRLRENNELANALQSPGLTDILVTFDHDLYGIECTATFGDLYATVINQDSPMSAIINAVRKAKESPRVE